MTLTTRENRDPDQIDSLRGNTAGKLRSRNIAIEELSIVLTPEEASTILPNPVDKPWLLRYVNCGLVVDYNDEGIPFSTHTYPGFNTFSPEDGNGPAFTNRSDVPQLTDGLIENILKKIAE